MPLSTLGVATSDAVSRFIGHGVFYLIQPDCSLDTRVTALVTYRDPVPPGLWQPEARGSAREEIA